MLGPDAEAEDVGQEVFIRFFESLHRYRGEASVATYLTRIAMNLSLNAIKSRKRRQWRFLSRDVTQRTWTEPAIEGEAVVESNEQASQIQGALSQLPAKHRAVVVLRLMEGYSTRETADLLDIPLGTVLSRLARAQEKLRTLLRE
jgi:RNA polymerase sigma-70 factor (ECF subfamily)